VPEALRGTIPPLERPPLHVKTLSPVSEGRFSHFQPPESSEAAFEHAKHINNRRQIQESQMEAERIATEAELRTKPEDCPPSPDDLDYIKTTVHDQPARTEMQPLPSVSTIASSEGFERSYQSRSISNGSVGFTSSASSPPNDGYLLVDKTQHHTVAHDNGPDFMRTADTIIPSGRHATAPGKPLEGQATDDDDDADDEGDSSEDEGIMMGGPKKP
jgi:hypothetical protein